MKKMILSLGLLLSITTFGGNGFERMSVDFSSAPNLDEEMKMDLKTFIQGQCQPAAASSRKIQIFEKATRYEKVDQGIMDVYHTVGIEFIGPDNNETLGYEEAVVVRFAGQNPAVDHVRVDGYTTNSACR